MNKKYCLILLTAFVLSISLLRAMEQQNESSDLATGTLNFVIESMKTIESQDSELLSLFEEKAKSKKSLFNKENFFLAATAVATSAATIAYYKYNTQAFEESWQYISEIPSPVKLFFTLGVGYLLLDKTSKTLQIEILKELYTNQLRKNKLMNGCIQQLTNIVKRESNEATETKVALNKFILENFMFKLHLAGNWSELKKNHEALENKFTIKYKHLEERMSVIKEKQEEMSYLADIFNELQDDIRYRKLLLNAESAQQSSDSYHKYNLGGVA